MLFAFAYSVLRLLLDIFDVRLRVRDPEAELLLLRHQLRVVRRQVKRPQLDMADRTIMAALSRRLGRASLVGMLVQPEAVIGSHRELVRRKWAAFGRRRGPGRPGLDAELQKLILETVKDNPRWGCVRIRGESLKLGYLVSATAIRKLLRRNRIGPAPLRSRLTWKAFLQAQASAILLTDFFSVDTVLLKRLYVLLYMELSTRRVIRFAVTDRPDGVWVSQQARNLCWELDKIGGDARFLVHDHDAKYGGGSDLVFQAEGIEVIITPVAAPKANAHMERQIRFDSARMSGLDPDSQPASSRAGPRRVVGTLQRSSSAPGSCVTDSDRAVRSGGLGWTGDLSVTLARTESRTVLGYMNEMGAVLHIRGR